jgi:hypothetical protein
VLHSDALTTLTDPATISRGRAYVRSGRVVEMSERGGVLRAQVQGSDLYRVRLTGSGWECDCPVGVTGALCKHCVAVVIAAEEGTDPGADGTSVGAAGTGTTSTATTSSGPAGTRAGGTGTTPQAGSPEPDPVWSWLAGLPRSELLDLLRDAVGQVDGLADILAREHLAATQDVAVLREEIDHTFTPRRRFYEYRQANEYAREAEGLVQVIEDLDAPSPPELLVAIERAIALAVRTILRSDDSSGYQGDQIRRLLDAHARAADALPGPLDRAGRRRLATWLHGFRFSGKQDFFDVDVDAYADTLGDVGVSHYRELVERSATTGTDEFAVRHARTRLAILDRDAEAIVRAVGGDLTAQHQVIAVVQALDEAGLGRLAVQHATRGITLTRTHRHGVLVDRLVVDAVERGDLAEAVTLRRNHFRLDPGSTAFAALRSAAQDADVWAAEQAAAESCLAERAPHAHVSMLLGDDRDDEAWEFATAHPQAASIAGAWERLCARRSHTAPADTLPVYRDLVTTTLRTTDRRAYVAAARLLDRMRSAAQAAGRDDEFAAFLTETVEANRRRPTCMATFQEHGLIRADRSVVRQTAEGKPAPTSGGTPA